MTANPSLLLLYLSVLNMMEGQRTMAEDVKKKELESLQKSQNNLLRTLENVRIKDKVSIKSMLDKNKMPTINQMHAQVKLTEMWKSVNYKNYPLNIGKLQPANNGRESRGVTAGKLIEPATLNTFVCNATRLWNNNPGSIKESKSISVAKKAIKTFCQSPPV